MRGFTFIVVCKTNFGLLCQTPTNNVLCKKNTTKSFSLRTWRETKTVILIQLKKCTVEYLGKSYLYTLVCEYNIDSNLYIKIKGEMSTCKLKDVITSEKSLVRTTNHLELIIYAL